MKVKYCH